MPPKKKVDLPDHVRAAVLADVELTYKHSLDADEASKIRIYLAVEQGLDTYEIAEELDISQPTVSRWARQGREAQERRGKEKAKRESARNQPTGEDPVRPGQREPVG